MPLTENEALARAGREERVDHRNLAVRAAEALAQGDEDRAAELSREPNVHLGPAAAMAIKRTAQGKLPPAPFAAAAEGSTDDQLHRPFVARSGSGSSRRVAPRRRSGRTRTIRTHR